MLLLEEEEGEDFLFEGAAVSKQTLVADWPQMKDFAADLDFADNGAAQGMTAPALDTAPAETRSLSKSWVLQVPWDHF